MSLKNKIFTIVLRVICGLLLVLAVFLGIMAIIFKNGGGNPNLFGSNIYLVQTEAFGFLKNGTAVFAQQVPPAEIQTANVVIFNLDNGKPALAQVTSSDLTDGVYTFKVRTENDSEITLTQNQIVAKGMRYNDFLGGIISFAVSPVGMMIIAILPAVLIIVIELVRYAGKILPQPQVETIKKQYEVPTYSPEAQQKTQRRGAAEAARAYKGAALDNSIGLYDRASKKSANVERERSEYMETLAKGKTSPLFTAPARQSSGQRPARQQTMPLSQKKLNEAIAETKAEHELEEMKKKRSQLVKEIQTTRGAAIAAEKDYETSERNYRRISETVGTDTSALSKTAVFSDFKTGELSSPQKKQQPPQKTAPSEPPRPEQGRPSRLQPPSSRQQIRNPESRISDPSQLAQRAQSQPTSPLRMNNNAAAAAAAANEGAQRRSQRPPLRLGQDDSSRQYSSGLSGTRNLGNTTTSIPRLDALFKEEENDNGFDIEDILAGLDKRKN